MINRMMNPRTALTALALALTPSPVHINCNGEFYPALDLDPNTDHDSSTQLNMRAGCEGRGKSLYRRSV